MSKRERLHVRYNIALSERQEKGMQQISSRTGVTKSKIIRRAIDVYLQVDHHKQELKDHIRTKS